MLMLGLFFACSRPRSLAKQGDNALGCVHLSFHLSLLSRQNRLSHYKSMMFVCVSKNLTDVVDRLLIICRDADLVVFACQSSQSVKANRIRFQRKH